MPGERYEQGSRIKAVIIEVRSEGKGPQVVLSRRTDELLRQLFELEVPEIADGLVVIRQVAREPGYRAKIAVESKVQGVDPVGACVGPRGSRVRMVVSELRGEKIDIIPWNDEPARFVAKALAPAKVREVYVDDENRQATVVVPDGELSLAIGKEGLNARLAHRLTGWRIDIVSETEYYADDTDTVYTGAEGEEDEFPGRCIAVTSSGKRCPNQALEAAATAASPPIASWPPGPRERPRRSAPPRPPVRRVRRRRPQSELVRLVARDGVVTSTSTAGWAGAGHISAPRRRVWSGHGNAVHCSERLRYLRRYRRRSRVETPSGVEHFKDAMAKRSVSEIARERGVTEDEVKQKLSDAGAGVAEARSSSSTTTTSRRRSARRRRCPSQQPGQPGPGGAAAPRRAVRPSAAW